MKRAPFFPVFAMLMLWLGCGGSRESTSPEVAAPANPVHAVTVTPAQVFVDGEDRGLTPKTLRVRRGFGESVISLHVGKNLVRTFELERARTSNRSELDLTPATGSRSSFDLTDLNTTRNGVYLIPYFPGPVEVEDRQYGLTLIVEQ